MAGVFPIVNQARSESAVLARRFYDENRFNHNHRDPYDLNLPDYEWEWFLEAMEPSYKDFARVVTTDGQFAQTGLRAVKEVENGGRRMMLNAVRNDPVRVGWARVATGRETCAFCLMLVSRGPVYERSEDVGISDEEKALEILDDGADQAALKELMTRWHPGCDCIAVPVYDIDSWEGREDWKRAEDIWKDTTKGFTGRDKLNAFRRAIDNGTVNPQDFAVAA